MTLGLELVDVEDGAQLWSAYFNRKLADIFDVQGQIASEISDRLRVRLTADQRKRLTKRHTQNTEAYQLYMTGQWHWGRRNEESMKRSLECFQLAVERDPSYTLAYCALARAYGTAAGVYGMVAPSIGLPKARAAVTKAIELDESLAEAHAILAGILSMFEWNFRAGEKEFQRAIQLNPNDSATFLLYGISLMHEGRFNDAETAMRRGLQNDPLSLLLNVYLGVALLFGRQYEAAAKQLLVTLDLDPTFPDALLYLAATEWYSRRREEAIARLEKALAVSGADVRMRCVLATCKAFAGCKAEALAELDSLLNLRDKRYVSPVHLSQVYVGLGDLDQALDLLEKGFQDRDPALRLLMRAPALEDAMRAHPRFQDLQHRLGIAP